VVHQLIICESTDHGASIIDQPRTSSDHVCTVLSSVHCYIVCFRCASLHHIVCITGGINSLHVVHRLKQFSLFLRVDQLESLFSCTAKASVTT